MIIIGIFMLLFLVITVVFSCFRSKLKALQRELSEEQENKSYIEADIRVLKAILKLKPIIMGVFLGIVVVFMLFSSIYFTNEQEIGFVSMFGQTSLIEGPGMHFKVPFLSKKHVYDATTKGLPIGYTEEDNETYEEDSLMITSDFNFVNVDFYVEYRIADPIEYCYGSDNPEEILSNICKYAIRDTVRDFLVDDVITTGKSELEMKVRELMIEKLAEHKTGIAIGNVTIQDSEPPTSEVTKAFKEVENEKQNAESVVNNAKEYENTQIPAAEAKAEQVKQSATAAKTEKVNSAKEEVARFEALFTEYENNPQTVKQRLYYEALQDILPKMEIIIGKDSKVIYVKDGKVTN